MYREDDLPMMKDNYIFYRRTLQKYRKELKTAYDFEKPEIERKIRCMKENVADTERSLYKYFQYYKEKEMERSI